ncbi:hypothetical protein NC653_026626 [Populus alba x Populus x berolinensis]|uniref:Uncharacterized protein n=1 Tax=Populus alba x Populus x berolinensis TaxID=444605 RepID=A0AAD6ME87_9ROSI|nr:hypothetical protein NC653_026626 [Populus alba x Populus x berolinensis]
MESEILLLGATVVSRLPPVRGTLSVINKQKYIPSRQNVGPDEITREVQGIGTLQKPMILKQPNEEEISLQLRCLGEARKNCFSLLKMPLLGMKINVHPCMKPSSEDQEKVFDEKAKSNYRGHLIEALCTNSNLFQDWFLEGLLLKKKNFELGRLSLDIHASKGLISNLVLALHQKSEKRITDPQISLNLSLLLEFINPLPQSHNITDCKKKRAH